MKISIGQFSHESCLTIKMLRHYDAIGLLIPYEKDFMTGYRYYDVNQLITAQEIIKYKKMGFSLKKIKDLFASKDDQYAVKLRLRDQLNEIEKEIENLIGVKSHLLSVLKENKGGTAMNKEDIFSQNMSELLNNLSGELQTEIIKGFFKDGNISPSISKKIGSEICNKLVMDHRIEIITDIIRNSSRETEINIIRSLENENPELAILIKEKMYLFEEIKNLDDHSIQLWLREIEMNDLVISLKSSSSDLVNSIKKNMSERAWKLTKETMNKMGPVKASTVEKIQFKLIQELKKLEHSGKIVIKLKE